VSGPGGEVLGTLCVVDDKPRSIDDFGAAAEAAPTLISRVEDMRAVRNAEADAAMFEAKRAKKANRA
jgi:hypothetical protein